MTDSKLLGIKLTSAAGTNAEVWVNMDFIEDLALIYIDLVRQGFIPAPSGPPPKPASDDLTAPRLEVEDFWLAFCVASSGEEHHALRINTVIDRLVAWNKDDSDTNSNENSHQDSNNSNASVRGTQLQCAGVHCISAVVKDTIVLVGQDSTERLLSVTSMTLRVEKLKRGYRKVTGTIEKCEFFMNSRIEANLCGLILSRERIECAVRGAAGSQKIVNEIERRSAERAVLSLEIVVAEWMAGFEARCGSQDIRLEGFASDSAVHSTIENNCADVGVVGMKHHVTIREVDAKILFSRESELVTQHQAKLHKAQVTMEKTSRRGSPLRDVNVTATFHEVCVNHFDPDTAGDTSCELPAAFFRELAIKRRDHVTSDIIDSDLSIQVDELWVRWSHRKHSAFIHQLLKLDRAIQIIDKMMALAPQRVDGDSKSDHLPKTSSVRLTPRASVVYLNDIAGVAPSVSIALTDSNLHLHKTHALVNNSFDCAKAHLSWKGSAPAVEVDSLSFNQKVVLGRQRVMAKTPSQGAVHMKRMAVHMNPGKPLLALILQIESLSSTDPAVPDKSAASSRPPAQAITVNCEQLVLAIECSAPEGQSRVFVDPLIYVAVLDDFSVKMTKATPSDFSDAMNHFLQHLESSDWSRRSFSDIIQKANTMDGAITAQTVTLSRLTNQIGVWQGIEAHFALTDVEWRTEAPSASGNDCGTLKTLIFDVSVFSQSLLLRIEKREIENAPNAWLTIQESMDTQNAQRDNGRNSDGTKDKSNFRFRYAGNVDIGFQTCSFDVPYGDNRSLPVIPRLNCAGTNVMSIVINEVVLSARQFHKMGIQFDSLNAFLNTKSTDESKSEVAGEIAPSDPGMQLVFLPAMCANIILHWKDVLSATVLSIPQEFSVSVDLALRQHISSSSSNDLPTANEALFSLNWDYVYPWLICLVTDEEDENQEAKPQLITPPSKPSENPGVVCKGVQWDLAIGSAQIVWWDGLTQELGVMLVVRELVSHGIILRAATASPSESEAKTDKTWSICEMTAYLDRLTGYLIRESTIPVDSVDDFEAAAANRPIPFDSINKSDFFWETTGTSYRLVRADEADDGLEDVEDQLAELFGESSAVVVDRMHESFIPIDYGFKLNAANKLRKLDNLSRSGSITMSSLNTPNAGSRPSTPRVTKHWSQTIRSRLSRLKRRTASMDNLLLNDGSCPIQVDSMKLLWTIETRDTVFYMVAVIVESFQLLTDAINQRQLSTRRRSEVGNSDAPMPTIQPSDPKEGMLRAPDVVGASPTAGAHISPDLRINRRGSTRDTLLDLLQQGKLGTKATGSDDMMASSATPDSRHNSSASETPNPTAIVVKQYTVDIHDVQINTRDDNSRSSVLIASDHIHLEVGMDALKTQNIVKFVFDVVTAHVAPIDVDITTRVVWYSNSAGVSPLGRSSSGIAPSPGSSLLKKVMEECSLSATYTQARATGASTIDADLSFLQVTTDRHQFYQLLYVTRHVLLAPPTVVRRTRRAQTSRASQPEYLQQLEGNDITAFMPPSGPTTPNSGAHPPPSTKKLHTQLVEELRLRESKLLSASARAAAAVTFRSIAFRALGLRIRLQLSPEVSGADHEFAEVRAEGLSGSHTFYMNQCTKFVLNLQWLEVTNLRPGQSSIAFEDPTAVVKAKLIVDERFQSSSSVNLTNQKGMLSVRAESGPIMRVLGQKLRVLDVLEVSMFPEVSNMIVIQLAADFYELVYKFFFEQMPATVESSEANSEQVLFGRKVASTPSNNTTATSTTSLSSNIGAGGSGSGYMSPNPKRGPGSAIRRKSTQVPNFSALSVESSSLSLVSTSSGGSNMSSVSDIAEDDDSSADGCELFYFKYIRIGNVRLRINCNGFFVNLSDFDLELPPFVCQSRLYTWQTLLQKFESHLKWYVTKESASSGLSQFKNRLLKWTPSGATIGSSDKKDKTKRQDEDTAVLNAQVLFGPYSGTAT